MIQESARPDAVPPAPPTQMTDAEFDAFCNELAFLAEETGALKLPEGAAPTVAKVRENALAQHFRIVLISPFQGGKSTIFNTLCGGRELSPTGFGIKTSAAIAEARYLEEPEGEEYAELEWRTDEELIAGMEELVFPFLAQTDLLQRLSGVLKGADGKQMSESRQANIRLSVPEHRLMLLKAIREASQSSDVRNRPDNEDVLRVALLTVENYEAAVKFRKERLVSLTRATSSLAFPTNWEHRSLADFHVDELAFLFLKRAVFYLREPSLRRLRASIIDAPGLQASRWDTAITTDCIRNAHAIIFLLGTQSRALAQSELGELERFRRFDLSTNVFYGYNARGRGRHLVRETLLPNDLGLLKRAGFDIPGDRVSIFNALLAYRARQFELLSEGRLPEESIKALSAKAKKIFDPSLLPEGGRNPIENARYLIVSELEVTYNDFTSRRIKEVSLGTAREAGVESNWEDLIARASQFVIARKGEAILLDRGGRKLVKVLERLDGDLADRALAAERNAESVEDEMRKAEAALKVFEREAELLQKRVEAELKEDGREWLWAELEKRLDDTSSLEASMKSVIDHTVSPRYLPSRLATEATDFVEKAIGGWQAGLTSGTSKALTRIVERIVNPAERRLQELASEAQAKAPGLLPGGAVFLVSESVQAPSKEIEQIVQTMYQQSAWSRGANFLESMADNLGIGDVISWMRGFVNKELLDTHSTWRSRLPTTILSVKSATLNLAKKIVDRQVAHIRNGVQEELDRAVQEVRLAYKQRVLQRQADMAKSFEEREQISQEATEHRLELGLFRQRVDDFVTRASKRLGIAS